jgi:hypothetical protein
LIFSRFLSLSRNLEKALRNGILISFKRGRLRSARNASKGSFIGREGIGWTVGFRAFGNGGLRWRLRVSHVSMKLTRLDFSTKNNAGLTFLSFLFLFFCRGNFRNPFTFTRFEITFELKKLSIYTFKSSIALNLNPSVQIRTQNFLKRPKYP